MIFSSLSLSFPRNFLYDFDQPYHATEDGEIRTNILSKLELNPKTSLQIVSEECERLENLRHNMERIEECNMSKINAIKQK